jgi:colicin import membrane protein
MRAALSKSRQDEPLEPRWGRGVFLSVCFHVALFSLIFFVPDSYPNRRIGGSRIYEVNLVEMPTKTASSRNTAPSSEKGKKIPIPPKNTHTKRITQPKPEKQKPVVIGKRVVETKTKREKPKIKNRKPKVSPSKLIDDAVSKIETKVKKENDQHLKQALSKLEAKAEAEQAGGGPGGGGDVGITMRMYQLAVEQRIKGNWSCPVALLDAKRMKDLKATVVVKVSRDGSIMKSWLEQKSSDVIFDKSVLRAVERSDPLPPFPEGYNRSFDLIEVRFNLSEMDEYY